MPPPYGAASNCEIDDGFARLACRSLVATCMLWFLEEPGSSTPSSAGNSDIALR